MRSSPPPSSNSGRTSDSKRSLSAASAALDTSSRRKISLFEYSEWIISCSSCLTSVWKPRVCGCDSVMGVAPWMQAASAAMPSGYGPARAFQGVATALVYHARPDDPPAVRHRRLPCALRRVAGPRMSARKGEGQVRIIGGRWRNTRLAVPDLPGLRPTSDRVRETLFNWLQPALPGARVLDLFAGSGALGLEAVSRGAASACLVERDAGLASRLREQVGKLDAAGQVEVLQED